MVVEITTFRLAAPRDTDAFLAADAAFQIELMQSDEGMLRRTVARDGDDWIAVTLWWTREHAAASAARVGEAASETGPAARFAALVDPSSVRVSRYDTLD